MLSCTCADVSNFKQNGIKIFIMNLYSKLKNLGKKNSAILKI